MECSRAGSLAKIKSLQTRFPRGYEAEVALRRQESGILDFVVQSLAEPFRHGILDTVGHKPYDILGPIDDRLTVAANVEMCLHSRAKFGLHLAIDVVGD